MTSILSFVTVVLIMTFFVTSSDSGSLVIDSLASGGRMDTPAWQRVFLGKFRRDCRCRAVTCRRTHCLQTAAIASALPFAIIMLLAAVGMWRALVIEGHQFDSLKSAAKNSPSWRSFWCQLLEKALSGPG